MTHCLVRKKIVKSYYKKLAVVSVKWFYRIVEIKLELSVWTKEFRCKQSLFLLNNWIFLEYGNFPFLYLYDIILQQNYIVIFVSFSLLNICQNYIGLYYYVLDPQCNGPHSPLGLPI